MKTFEEFDSGHLREYARHLARQGWTAGTVRTYLRVHLGVRGWAVREEHLAENVAQRHNATEPILDDGGHKSGDQQAGSAEDCQQLTAFVDQQASTAIDEIGEDREAAIKACRDRALMYFLSYSGVRGAEVLRDRRDERCQGLRGRISTSMSAMQPCSRKGSASTTEVSRASNPSATDAPKSPRHTNRELAGVTVIYNRDGEHAVKPQKC